MRKWLYPIKKDGKRLKVYVMWINMKQRCLNPNNPQYNNYGGRGITVCEEWINSYDDFCEWAFSHGYDEGADRKEQSIDRIDVNKGYYPENCRITTMIVQGRNRRNNRVIDGKCVAQIAEELGCTGGTVVRRDILGLPLDEVRDYDHILVEGYTVRELSELFGVDCDLIRNRVRKGERKLEKLIDPENKGLKPKILIEGKTLREISEMSGVKIKTVRHRYYVQGYRTLEELSKPVRR